MANWLEFLWRKMTDLEVANDSDLDRISVLQLRATDRRAEYAAVQDRAALTSYAGVSNALMASRKRMKDAETAHMIALQDWENKQSRQKSW